MKSETGPLSHTIHNVNLKRIQDKQKNMGKSPLTLILVIVWIGH